MFKSKYRKKYSAFQIEEMRRLFSEGYAVSYIARKFRCWPNAIWNHVYALDLPRKQTSKSQKHIMRNSKLTVSQVLRMAQNAHRRDFQKGCTVPT